MTIIIIINKRFEFFLLRLWIINEIIFLEKSKIVKEFVAYMSSFLLAEREKNMAKPGFWRDEEKSIQNYASGNNEEKNET